ncbi:cyclin-domain-containing protein [Emericellopsis atlantica]|uniref:Cyclin-domain-containing protein n=1 Tax=Emericellopsis atlantica TaxID=2614577 RepID=A0A9P7ZX05_9HYPO|nr:cyclin-domain-containing protein [Emericellopsis atlantica]KAG9259037.1 cyclin-domain-containing protein [Emericellopsis atlantica]
MAASTNTDTDTTMTQPAMLQLTPHEEYNLATLPAIDALHLLSANLETLVRITGDVPPTPPPRTPTDPQMTGLQAEKDSIARSSPSRTATPDRGPLAQQQQHPEAAPNLSRAQAASQAMMQQTSTAAAAPVEVDGVRLKSPTFPTFAALEYPAVITADEQSVLNAQHGAITRKFYSKLEPPISITEYLARLHRFCPMSTAVYLAASLYIYTLAIDQRAIPVTRKNVHRLVLAALRIATKALEDLPYLHRKIARVGGVSEAELARLEISFCFLAGFELVMKEERLREHWIALRSGRIGAGLVADVPPLLKPRRPRSMSAAEVEA